SHRLSVSIVLGMVNSVVICFWRNDYNLHHAVQKIITKDQHALVIASPNFEILSRITKATTCI
ncbi:hypothetical protein ACEV9D_13555, partial [Vibrio parahaemolyticus]